MLESEVFKITPKDFEQPQSDTFKEDVKTALIKSAEGLIGKLLWFLIPKKLKLWINAVLIYLENH